MNLNTLGNYSISDISKFYTSTQRRTENFLKEGKHVIQLIECLWFLDFRRKNLVIFKKRSSLRFCLWFLVLVISKGRPWPNVPPPKYAAVSTVITGVNFIYLPVWKGSQLHRNDPCVLLQVPLLQGFTWFSHSSTSFSQVLPSKPYKITTHILSETIKALL